MDNNAPLFTIIVPVYNAAEYLPRCINSLSTQLYSDFELILINDGSTDASLEICERAALQDLRIIVVNQVNQGVSEARNAGILVARGHYITFVDADDFLKRDFLRQFADEIKREDNELIVSGVIKYFGEEDKRNITYIYPSSSSLTVIPELDRNSLLSGPFAKCFKASVINANNLRFDRKFHFGEDAVFNLSFLQKIKNLGVLSYAGYYYFQTPGESLVKKKYPYEITYAFAQTVTELRYKLLAKFALDKDYINHIEKQRTLYIIGAILSNYSPNFKKSRMKRLDILRKHQSRIRIRLHLLPNGKYYETIKFIFKNNSAVITDILLRCLQIIKKY